MRSYPPMAGWNRPALSAIVGTSIFAVWVTNLAGSSPWLQFGIITIAVSSAALTALSSFLNLAERTEKHRSVGVH